MMLSIPLPQTPDGRTYRYSPNPNAHPRHFVIGPVAPDFVVADEKRARMKLDPRSKRTVCPYSGIIEEDENFLHPDDKKAALATVTHAATRDVQDLIDKALGGFNGRSSNGGFLKVEMKYTRSPRKPAPRFARRDLMRELVCDHCGRDYAVFAIGLFCCDCGAPNLRLHFAREVDLVKSQVELAHAQALQEELAYRLLGNAHEDVLTAFEATLKAVYLHVMGVQGKTGVGFKAVGNDFQNVEKGQRRYAEFGLDPYGVLDPDDLSLLKLNIQKRHIIGHNLGVMDEKFVVHDGNAKVGETVKLVAKDVIAFAESCQHVVDALDAWLPGASGNLPLPVAPAPTSIAATAFPIPKADKPMLDLNLSQLAERVAIWLSKQNDDGLTSSIVQSEAIEAAFADEDRNVLVEAIAELEMDGYVTTIMRCDDVPALQLTADFFPVFDPHALNSNPLLDAAELTKRILASGDTVSVATLHEQSGMPLRRFNPALALVLGNLDEQRIRREINSCYPTGWFYLDPTDRVALKRFLAQAEA